MKRSATFEFRTTGTAFLEHEHEFVSELSTGDAVKEEVDGVVEISQLVVDCFADVVNVVVTTVAFVGPIRLAYEHDDARKDAHEKGNGCTQAHHRGLFIRLATLRRFLVSKDDCFASTGEVFYSCIGGVNLVMVDTGRAGMFRPRLLLY